MSRGGTALQHTLRLLAIAAAFCVPLAAWADDYADVTQLLRSGKSAEALAKADQYIAAKPRDPQMRFLKGVVQSEAGRTADAIATFEALAQEYPELPEPYNNLAVLYASGGEFEKARAALESAIRTNPGYATAYENLGDVYAQLASQAYAHAQQLDAGNPRVRPKLALIRQLLSPAAKDGGKASAPGADSPASGDRRPAKGG
jgi:tetratricopeptide (TPR) repeat protein